MTPLRSGLFRGTVVHSRLRPKRHRLRYRIFMVLFDLDELEAMDGRLRLFAYNRAGLLSFHDRDHGDRSGESLRPWVERKLSAAGITPDGGAIELLCMPRVLGHVFNPISAFFYRRRDGSLQALIYEVNNTFGETHSYVLPVADQPGGLVEQRTPKRFYVSPFMEMDLGYEFHILPPEEATSIAIAARDADGVVLTASFAGKRSELSDAALLSAWLAHPLLSLKVLAGIHWEALCIWLKGTRFHANPRLRKTRTPPKPVTAEG